MPPTIETTAIKNVTPIVTPMTVKKLFSFCTRMVSRARRTAWMNCMTLKNESRDKRIESSRPSVSMIHKTRKLQTNARRECVAALVSRDQTVAQHHHAAGVRRDVGLVRDHHHRLSRRGQSLEHTHDLFRRLRVEVTRRLVGQQHRWIV